MTSVESDGHRPTIDDLTGDAPFAVLARQYWLSTKGNVKKVQASVVKSEIWDALEKDGFPYQSLLLLEQLQLLDRYLWPGYTEGASDQHVILLALLTNVKRREAVGAWSAFVSDSAQFSSFFRRVLRLTIEESTPLSVRSQLLAFVIGAFQSLDTGIIRKECASLVGIGLWHNLHNEAARQRLLGKTVQLGKAWRAAEKRYDTADKEGQSRIQFERKWLNDLVLHFFDQLYSEDASNDRDVILYCERVLELLSDLLSQLPTRRYVNTLLADLNILSVIRLSPLHADGENDLLRDLTELLQHYMVFPIEDHTGRELKGKALDEAHEEVLRNLQRISIQHFKDDLTILGLSNLKSLATRDDLQSHLDALDDEALVRLCGHLGMRTTYNEASLVVQDRRFFMDLILTRHETPTSFRKTVQDTAVVPTEDDIFLPSFNRTESYDGTRPLALPRLNLQYLTMSDFLWRSFVLYRAESFYEIRKHIEDTVKRLQPRLAGSTVRFDGFSKMAVPITRPSIVDVVPANVAEAYPALVQAEISVDVSKFTPNVRREWETLHQDDVIYLVAVLPPVKSRALTNGTFYDAEEQRTIRHVRCAEIMHILDEDGKLLKQKNGEQNGYGGRGRKRRLIVKLDAKAYQTDKTRVDSGKPDVYDSINLIIKRRGRENNFKPILESIQNLVLSETPAPPWVQDVFLGYSDPASATYKQLPNRLKSMDYRDTFLDWQHLADSLPGQLADSVDPTIKPPYVLETIEAEVFEERPAKKRRREKAEPVKAQTVERTNVSTYPPINTGPYLTDAPKTNQVRFTPAQVEAITSGMQPGLSVVVGPPGTGKTDVATQIISNLYHNFPRQRILLVAHSNQALNQLFAKIAALDIDPRHLLRLGHGEEELETTASYSKTGRIESLMEICGRYLTQVTHLAASIGAPDAHGNSCETADYFNQVYIRPAWTKFWDLTKTDADAETVATSFPFLGHFSDAPQPLFPKTATREQVIEIATGCQRHLDHIFTTLEDARPFELLKSQRDKSNYLLLHSARIVAMTSTHAAMRRSEIVKLGFTYDSIVMEEAAQITEIEAFIPFALQADPTTLRRIVLIGDHLQNAPIISNPAFRHAANLEQSLFLRLNRLSVPTVVLNAQGRTRPSLAALYAWRYPTLTNLPLTTTDPTFTLANPGLRHTAQFIDVPTYKGRGESTPSPHFVQNLGEAEFAVALYQYLRLTGYPASRISILAMYAGQRALIRDVLAHRCRNNPLFGLPRAVSTVDRYQGEQNDIVILSLVRTERVGYLRDLRRLTVALSRARTGLYVLGRKALFESVLELRPVFEKLFDADRGEQLVLVQGEKYPATDGGRAEDDEVPDEQVKVVQGVEDLGRYVYELTQEKVRGLKEGREELVQEERVRIGESSDEDEEEAPLMEDEGDGDVEV